MCGEPAFFQHVPCVAADREYAPFFDGVMAIEHECVWRLGDAAPVDDRLPIILASGFKPFDLEQSVRRRIKARRADFFFDLGIGNFERPNS